jgi:hypothetical protein
MVNETRFIGHIGVPAIHDGTIIAVEAHDAALSVVIEPQQAWSAKRIRITFHCVERVLAKQPEGMLLYGLSEWTDSSPLRRFVFTNWYDKDDQECNARGQRRSDARLELRALGFSIREASVAPPDGSSSARR